MNGQPGRQPPHFVPTLTEVVRAEAAAPAVPAPPPWSEGAVEQMVDRVTDRVLATVMHRLEARVAEQVQTWWQAHAWQCGQDVARTLLDAAAADVRDAVADALVAEASAVGR